MQWHQTSAGKERLALETELLTMDYPQMTVVECRDGKIRVEGHLGPNELCDKSHYVVSEYPSNYPHGRVRVWCPKESFPYGTPHRFKDDALCVDHGDLSPDDTMSTVLGWTVQWLALYEEFRRTGEKW